MDFKLSGIYSRTIEKAGAKFGVLSLTIGCFLNPMKLRDLRDVSIKKQIYNFPFDFKSSRKFYNVP